MVELSNLQPKAFSNRSFIQAKQNWAKNSHVKGKSDSFKHLKLSLLSDYKKLFPVALFSSYSALPCNKEYTMIMWSKMNLNHFSTSAAKSTLTSWILMWVFEKVATLPLVNSVTYEFKVPFINILVVFMVIITLSYLLW